MLILVSLFRFSQNCSRRLRFEKPVEDGRENLERTRMRGGAMNVAVRHRHLIERLVLSGGLLPCCGLLLALRLRGPPLQPRLDGLVLVVEVRPASLHCECELGNCNACGTV